MAIVSSINFLTYITKHLLVGRTEHHVKNSWDFTDKDPQIRHKQNHGFLLCLHHNYRHS